MTTVNWVSGLWGGQDHGQLGVTGPLPAPAPVMPLRVVAGQPGWQLDAWHWPAVRVADQGEAYRVELLSHLGCQLLRGGCVTAPHIGGAGWHPVPGPACQLTADGAIADHEG